VPIFYKYKLLKENHKAFIQFSKSVEFGVRLNWINFRDHVW